MPRLENDHKQFPQYWRSGILTGIREQGAKQSAREKSYTKQLMPTLSISMHANQSAPSRLKSLKSHSPRDGGVNFLSHSDFKLNSQMRLGPVSLKVMDLGLMMSFYERDLGLTVLRRNADLVELGPASSADPIIVLRQVTDAQKAPADAAGLYHFALLVPDRRNLAAAYFSLGNAGVIFDGFADHLVSEALYLTDPEGNGIEIYNDRPRSLWKFDEAGYVQIATQPLDINSLLKEMSGKPQESLKAIAEGTRVGHVHLKVTDLQRSIAFYRDILGLDLMNYWGSAAFLSVGQYHHHIGMNTWESLSGKPVKKDWAGLEYVTITVPQDNLNQLSSKLADSQFVHIQSPQRLFISDPDEIEFVLKAS